MEKKKKSYRWFLVGGSIVVLLLIFGLILSIGDVNSNLDDGTNVTYDSKLYNSFLNELNNFVDNFDSSVDYETVKMDFVNKVIELQKNYEDGNGVSYVANKLVNNTLTIDYASTSDYLGAMSMDIGSFFSGLFGGSSSSSKNLTMRSTTVCDGGTVKDSKYCVDKLNAEVYVTDKKSKKWVVLVHAFMLNGEQIYNALGEMYTSQGYNVLAPDLRGFGDSDGSVAMGYLESLDVYDWIKYLNSNPSDFGVNSAPDTIIVHGVSLGGATTLQLATNPDIASASGKAPYTKNLTQLHVKGFVDDCGYTSMTGIITGMLSGGSSDQISSLLSNLGIDGEEFLATLKDTATKLGISGFENIDVNSIINSSDLKDAFEKASDVIQGLIPNSGSQNQITVPNAGSLWEGQSSIPNIDTSTNWWNNIGTGTSFTGNYVVMPVENSLFSSSTDVTDTLIQTVLMQLVGIGLDDSNYAKYSNAFSSGRSFPSGAKVMIIHGTADTTVPHSNADTVATNIGQADLFYKWDAEGNPHAFVVVGSDKDKYTNLVASFTKYVDTGVKNTDVFAESTTDNEESSSGISGVFKKITDFFKGLFS